MHANNEWHTCAKTQNYLHMQQIHIGICARTHVQINAKQEDRNTLYST